MIFKKRRKKGQSIIEFSTVIILILVAFMVFQKYIVRGFTGRWKSVGDAFGQGRIYDPNKTVECATNVFFDGQTPKWYGQECFDEKCKDDCLKSTRNQKGCTDCITSCENDKCNDFPG